MRELKFEVGFAGLGGRGFWESGPKNHDSILLTQEMSSRRREWLLLMLRRCAVVILLMIEVVAYDVTGVHQLSLLIAPSSNMSAPQPLETLAWTRKDATGTPIWLCKSIRLESRTQPDKGCLALIMAQMTCWPCQIFSRHRAVNVPVVRVTLLVTNSSIPFLQSSTFFFSSPIRDTFVSDRPPSSFIPCTLLSRLIVSRLSRRSLQLLPVRCRLNFPHSET